MTEHSSTISNEDETNIINNSSKTKSNLNSEEKRKININKIEKPSTE